MHCQRVTFCAAKKNETRVLELFAFTNFETCNINLQTLDTPGHSKKVLVGHCATIAWLVRAGRRKRVGAAPATMSAAWFLLRVVVPATLLTAVFLRVNVISAV